MPIFPETDNPYNSSWYNIMQSRAMAWNEFEDEMGASVSGGYLADRFYFEATFSQDGINYQFAGRRQLTTVTSNVIPMNGRIFEEITVKCSPGPGNQKAHFAIKLKSFWSFLFGKMGKHRFSKKMGKYVLRYNSEDKLAQIKASGLFKGNKVRSCRSNESGFEMVLLKLPENLKQIEGLIQLCNQLLK